MSKNQHHLQLELIEYFKRAIADENQVLVSKADQLSSILSTFAAFSSDVDVSLKSRELSKYLKDNQSNASSEIIRTNLSDLLDVWDNYAIRNSINNQVMEGGKLGVIITVTSLVISLITLFIGDQGLARWLGNIGGSTQENSTVNPVLLWISLIQLIFILCFFFFTLTKKGKYLIFEEDELIKNKLKLVMKQFFLNWKYLWMNWLILYLWFAVWWGDVFDVNDTFGWALADILNGATAFFFFNLFLIMDMPSYNTARSPNRKDKYFLYRALYLSICIIIIVISVLGRFNVLESIGNGGSILLSILVGLAMMHFFGRLDSQFLNVNRLLLIPLYFYAAIQVTWISFEQNESLIIAVFSLAFILKFILAYLVTSWLRTRNFENYFVNIPEAYEEAKKLNK